MAKLLNCSAAEIIITSNGTEADNWILRNAIANLKVKRIISSRIEHHAILHTLEELEQEQGIRIDFVKVKSNGTIDSNDLASLLSEEIPTLVSLMHVNNEIGTVLNLETVGRLCRQYNAYFHSDTVQSVGKCELDLQELAVDFIVGSAHKFHGPKGIGFAYIRKGIQMQPMIFGGEQEKGLRAGTESVHNIAGMAKALEISLARLSEERIYVSDLKNYAMAQLQTRFKGIKFNGADTFYNLLNVCLPIGEDKAAMLLFTLDMKGIAVSRGSACQSGSPKPSHVLAEFLTDEDIKKPSLRISFSHYNTKEDIDYLIEALTSI